VAGSLKIRPVRSGIVAARGTSRPSLPSSATASPTRIAVYERHRPEETPLYGIVETYYPRFLARLEVDGGSLPAFVKQEFDDFLKCGLLEHGFLRVKCDGCQHEHLVAFSANGGDLALPAVHGAWSRAPRT
jgi:hypothetical protein